MLASDVWIEMLAILSHEDAYNSVDPMSSEDVADVVDFHWFTDCHLEAIFYMNLSRLRLDLMFVWSPAFLREPGSTLYSSAPSITTIRLHITTSLKSISQKRWLYHLMVVSSNSTLPERLVTWPCWKISQQDHVTNRFLSSLVKIASSWCPLW